MISRNIKIEAGANTGSLSHEINVHDEASVTFAGYCAHNHTADSSGNF